MIDRTLQVPVERVKEKLAMDAGSPALPGQEDDIAHGFDSTHVMGMHCYRQRYQEVIHGEAVTAFSTHSGDIYQETARIFLHGQRGFFNQLAAGGGVNRAGEVNNMRSHTLPPF
jgi:hypothetical protein